jgi:hypothetical protein
VELRLAQRLGGRRAERGPARAQRVPHRSAAQQRLADWSGGARPLGDENGDKCNNDAGDDPNAQWVPNNANFLEGTPYNEIISGHYYFIQMEWSNQSMGCYDHYTLSAGPSANFTAQVVSGKTVSFNASGSGGGIAQYVWQFNDGPGQTTTVKTTSPTISHTFPSTGSYRVALTTMAGNGRSHGTAKAIQVSPPHETLTVSKSGTGAGSVTSSPAGISCAATCSHSYNQGTAVKLTAHPASGRSSRAGRAAAARARARAR